MNWDSWLKVTDPRDLIHTVLCLLIDLWLWLFFFLRAGVLWITNRESKRREKNADLVSTIEDGSLIDLIPLQNFGILKMHLLCSGFQESLKLFTLPHFSNSHKQDVEICSGTVFTQKTCCTTHLNQILPVGEIYHKSSDQIWVPLPGNGSQRTSQHCRLGLTHYGACLMTDNTSLRWKVANSFSHSGYISWLHTYSGLSGNLTSCGLAEECQRAKCGTIAETNTQSGSRRSIGGIIYKAWDISPKSKKRNQPQQPRMWMLMDPAGMSTCQWFISTISFSETLSSSYVHIN